MEFLGNEITMAFSARYGEIGGQARPSVNLQTTKKKTYGDGTPDFTASERKRHLLWGCHSGIGNTELTYNPEEPCSFKFVGKQLAHPEVNFRVHRNTLKKILIEYSSSVSI